MVLVGLVLLVTASAMGGLTVVMLIDVVRPAPSLEECRRVAGEVVARELALASAERSMADPPVAPEGVPSEPSVAAVASVRSGTVVADAIEVLRGAPAPRVGLVSIGSWDAAAGVHDCALLDGLAGRRCFAGVAVSSVADLAAWVLWFPPVDAGFPAGPPLPSAVLWRFWCPAPRVDHLDAVTDGLMSAWVRDGLVTVTDGDWVDYRVVLDQVRLDASRYRIVLAAGDQVHTSGSLLAGMRSHGVDAVATAGGFGLSLALHTLAFGVNEAARPGARRLNHGGHPVARWCVESAALNRSTSSDRQRLVTPDRSTGHRIEGIEALAFAIDAELIQPWADDSVRRRELARQRTHPNALTRNGAGQ